MVNETLNSTAQSLLQVNPVVTNILVALVIIFIGLVVGRVIGRIIGRILQDFRIDKTVHQRTGLRTSIQRVLSNGISYVIYVIFFIIALNYIGITHILFTVLAIALIVVLVATLLLSLKDSIPNMAAYRTITKKKSIRVGNRIEYKGVEGEVIEINITETVLKTEKGERIHIPNAAFIKEPFVQKELNKHKNTKKLGEFSS